MNTIEMLNIISKDSTFFAYRRELIGKKYFFYEIRDANGAVKRLPFQQYENDVPEGMFLSGRSMTATDWVIEKKKIGIIQNLTPVLTETKKDENEKG